MIFRITAVLTFLLLGIGVGISPVSSQTLTLQDIAGTTAPLPQATIYVAREVVTLDPQRPSATAIAVVGDRILATGTLEELQASAGDQPYMIDETFADKVIVPGFIAQHDHPALSAFTMSSEIISIEDWALPSGLVPAASTEASYRQRLVEAHEALEDPEQLLLTWGYHHYFHGPLTRDDLDAISTTRPIFVWHRSTHEFFLNSRALEIAGISAELVAAMPEGPRAQTSYEQGHFWEAGLFQVLDKILPLLVTPEQFRGGLEFTKQYFHANGVTLASEPGGIYSEQIQQLVNSIFSDPGNPFRYYFIPDGKSIYGAFPDTVISETEKTLSWGQGMTRMLPGQIKLFSDGAIYSQLMQVREPYMDGHHGEWIMQPEDFARAFRVYWDAGYQIHVHVNGDAGLDVVLDTLEANMRRNPRYDHRTLIVHFAVSQPDQVKRIARLGAIVSGNPYYVTMLADKYSTMGLGPERADAMVRMGDLERAGVSYSYHSDMPMAPAQPLFLMDSAVNRRTVSGRIAGKEQRSSREAALRAVTLEAAYSLQLEQEVGSIVAGKLANFTILSENPVTGDPATIKDILVWGTVHEGRKLPVENVTADRGAVGPIPNAASYVAMALNSHTHGPSVRHHHHGDVCALNRVLASSIPAGWMQ